MQVKTNRWREQRWRSVRHSDGTEEGYYTSEPYMASFVEHIIEFDTPQEKYAYHAWMRSIRPQAEERVAIIKAEHKAATNEAIAKARAQYDKEMAEYVVLPWYKRMWKGQPYMESDNPRLSDDDETALKAAALVMKHPEALSDFVFPVDWDDHRLVVSVFGRPEFLK